MNTNLRVNPISFIQALSTTLELSNSGISKHHLGTAIISKALGEAIKLPQAELRNLIYAALLHDIGAAKDWDEKHLIVHNDHSDHVFHHALEGSNILRKSCFLISIADYVRCHHDRFLGPNPSGYIKDEIPLESRILHLADRIDVLIDQNTNILAQRKAIQEHILESDFFDPQLIEIFMEISKAESFWLDIANVEHNQDFIQDLDLFGRLFFDIDDLISIAIIFADIVDATSAYTAKHSENVAKVSQFLAVCSGFSKEEAKQFYLAGLLHDLGKLSIPNHILNKEGPLNDDEYRLIKQHPYYSRIILQRIDGFQTIAKWIGQHHECMDGTGYPDRIKADRIVLGSRILQMADIFCALSEHRPYRETLDDTEILVHLQKMGDAHKLDVNLIKPVKNNIHFLRDLVSTEVKS